MNDIVDSLMEDIQEYASTWSLVGSRFDDGDRLEEAKELKEALRQRLKKVLSK